MTNMDFEALKENRRGKLCCCDKEKFVHRFTLSMIVIDILVLIGMSILYVELMFYGYDQL